jgi:hypothetical protein
MLEKLLKLTEIHLFEHGKKIQDGDLLLAKVDSVEGHRRVTLEVVNRA